MKFFNLSNKNSVLCDLNGSKPKFKFRINGLTEKINELRIRIEHALIERNFTVDGIDIEFVHDVHEDQHVIRTFRIKTDPDKCADVCMQSSEIRVYGTVFAYHEDRSGSIEVYCGDNWKRDRHNFIFGIRHHLKMNNKPRTVLRYETHNGENFHATDDIGRGYYPQNDEPLHYTLEQIESEVVDALSDVLDYIQSFPALDAADRVDPFVEPDPIMLTNELFSGISFIANIDSSVMYDIEKKRKSQIEGTWRLINLSLCPPKDHPYANIMNDGFTYCDMIMPDGTITSNNWHYDGMNPTKIIVLPKKYDGVYLIDQGVAEKFRKEWFDKNPDKDTMDNESYNELIVVRAKTLVHINDYDGSFEKPVVVINRMIHASEIHRFVEQNAKSYTFKHIDLGMFHYIPSDKTSDNPVIHYLEMKETKPESVGNLSMMTELVVMKHEMRMTTENIKVTADQDAIDVCSEFLLQKVYNTIVEQADKNRASVDAKSTTQWDVAKDSRKIFARIFAASNMIAVKGRRGPANFAIVSEEIYQMLFFGEKQKSVFYSPDGNIGGLKFFIARDIGDKVIVGRGEKKADSSGIFVKCNNLDVSDYVFDKSNEIIESVNFTYAIECVGSFMPYFSFEVK